MLAICRDEHLPSSSYHHLTRPSETPGLPQSNTALWWLNAAPVSWTSTSQSHLHHRKVKNNAKELESTHSHCQHCLWYWWTPRKKRDQSKQTKLISTTQNTWQLNRSIHFISLGLSMRPSCCFFNSLLHMVLSLGPSCATAGASLFCIFKCWLRAQTTVLGNLNLQKHQSRSPKEATACSCHLGYLLLPEQKMHSWGG